MKPTIISQEILLFTGTSFSKKEFCLKDSINNKSANYSLAEELEKACWAGMLCELLPELTVNSSPTVKIFTWKTLCAQHFVLINQGTHPHPVTPYTSIDPHLFLLSHLNRFDHVEPHF